MSTIAEVLAVKPARKPRVKKESVALVPVRSCVVPALPMASLTRESVPATIDTLNSRVHATEIAQPGLFGAIATRGSRSFLVCVYHRPLKGEDGTIETAAYSDVLEMCGSKATAYKRYKELSPLYPENDVYVSDPNGICVRTDSWFKRGFTKSI